MQPTDQQVQRSLDALRRGGSAGDDLPERRLVDLPAAVLLQLGQDPPGRTERLERAMRRLAAGDAPSAQDLADRMIGRLVCDRLR